MIENLTYDQILEISNELRENAAIIEKLANSKNISKLQDFASMVDGYSKYLETIVEINKDADKALIDLTSK